jgi:hypothetical protein
MSSMGAEFFGHYAMQDIAKVAGTYFRSSGELMPRPFLRADMARLGRRGVSRQTYSDIIDEVYAVRLEGQPHLDQFLVREARQRELQCLDPLAYEKQGLLADYLKEVRRIQALGQLDEERSTFITEGLTDEVFRPQGIPTGISVLDAALDGGGPCPGDLYVLEGEPKVGKTRQLCNIAVHAAVELRLGVFYQTYEVRAAKLKRRLLRIACCTGGLWYSLRPEGFH